MQSVSLNPQNLRYRIVTLHSFSQKEPKAGRGLFGNLRQKQSREGRGEKLKYSVLVQGRERGRRAFRSGAEELGGGGHEEGESGPDSSRRRPLLPLGGWLPERRRLPTCL